MSSSPRLGSLLLLQLRRADILSVGSWLRSSTRTFQTDGQHLTIAISTFHSGIHSLFDLAKWTARCVAGKWLLGFEILQNSRRNELSKLVDLFLDAAYAAVGLHNSTLYGFYWRGGGRGEGGRGISRDVLSHGVASVMVWLLSPLYISSKFVTRN